MAQRDRKLRGTEESSASELPITLGLSGGTLNLTVPENEIRLATIALAASCAVIGGKSDVVKTRG
jgi:hypothetical protein